MGRARSQQKNRPVFFYGLMLILLIGLSLYIFFNSAFFALTKAVVKGNKTLSDNEIVALAGVHQGQNIFKIDIDQIVSKVMANPMVKEVSVSRKFPSTLEITVVEREAVAVVPHGNSFIIIDDKGFYLRKETDLAKLDLPVVTGLTAPAESYPGQAFFHPNIEQVMAVLLTIPQGLKNQISEVNVADINNILVYTLDGIEARFGDGVNSSKKWKALEEILGSKAVSQGKKIQYIELKYDTPPVVRYYPGQ